VALPELSRDEILRYSRHLSLPEVGADGQRRLKAARVLCIGAGGLGSPAMLYLAAAGVGTLGLVDFDVVDFTNLHRQIIHGTSDVGRSKLGSAAARLREINPEVRVEMHEMPFGVGNARELVAAYDIVLDGTDNFPTRYLVNDACVMVGRPNAWGAISAFEGQASVFAAPGGPCYRCLHPVPPPPGLIPSCAEGGVLGVLPGVIGTIQATETIKLVLGIGEPLVGRLLLYDALKMRMRDIRLRRDPECPVCGETPSIRELREYDEHCSPAHDRAAAAPISVSELKSRMDRGDAPLVIDVREPYEHAICRIPGAVLIPVNELPGRIADLDRTAETVVYCKVGERSSKAVRMLAEHGFSRARNLTGGVLEWVTKIDPTQPRY
jgi:adenylyltransferase/sulfurtransferase